ncbi:NAD(P)-binding protein [Periconia macrospinosa]|uniref:NAD(P)-binding protein n=1 Tax=Periconia macrospinosa TaxID=97972 RepID=A0A2V1E3V3_9PLEO|nr:NAD(P)-binding protein [Periconia macrospinosa]
MPSNVLIFGPTGNVGRAAAIEAHAKGAKVWLAMRDTSKSIEGLNEDSNYARIQADLSKPSSLESAVKQSGAKSVFVYTIPDSGDSMKESFNALKSSGVTYIVLLSSFGVQGEASDEANQEKMIPALHARTEMALQETGIAYTAIRPAFYSTNILAEVADIKKGHVKVPALDAVFDFISPQDIGNVCGSLLVNQPTETPKIIPLCGPQIITQRNAYGIISRVIGHSVEVSDMDDETFVKKGSWPEPIARALLSVYASQMDQQVAYPDHVYKDAVANIKRYSGKEPTTFEDWVRANRSAFD